MDKLALEVKVIEQELLFPEAYSEPAGQTSKI